jgi:GNAT superfamily N-acetyltransferase
MPAQSITIRIATSADVPGMFHVRTNVKQNLLTLQQMRLMEITPDSVAESLEKDCKAWVAEDNKHIVAFSIADRATSSIFALFVLPEYEGKGLGKNLLELAVNWLAESGAKKLWLRTAPNTRAAAFYRKRGWTCARIEKNGELRLEHTVP